MTVLVGLDFSFENFIKGLTNVCPYAGSTTILNRFHPYFLPFPALLSNRSDNSLLTIQQNPCV